VDNNNIYLDTYVLQQDMRIRMPKAILSNMNAEKGKTLFDIFYNQGENALVMKIHDSDEKKKEE
jgi:hypothetical protein